MKILQISDVHFSQETRNIEKIKKMLNMIRSSINLSEVDAVVLCGDIVNKNSMDLHSTFQQFKNELSDKPIPIYISCGNHDVNRKLIKPMFITHVNTLNSNDKIDSFVLDNESNQFTDNTKHFDQYQDLIKAEINPEIITNLYYITKINDGDKKIGIFSINSAWFSCGQTDDYGRIIFPRTYIYEGIRALKDCSIKIFLTHFPITYFAEFNRTEIQQLVASNFDVYFCGHTHRNESVVNYSSESGIFSCTCPSLTSLTGHDNNGFILHDFNWELMVDTVLEMRFVDGLYVEYKRQGINLPVNELKKDKIILVKAIQDKKSTVIDYATKKFCMFEDDDISFLDIYNDPVLKEKDKIRSYTSDLQEKGITENKNVAFQKLLDKDNYVIYGGEKSGKTALLYRLYIEYLTHFLSLNYLPVFIDMKHYYKTTSETFPRSIKEFIRNEYNLSIKYVELLLTKSNIVFLIDNYKSDKTEINDQLLGIIGDSKFVFSVEKSINPSVKNKIDDHLYNEVYIHDITRKQLRELTNKWPSITPAKQSEVIEKIVAIFSQLNICCNYWTASLFLEVFEKSKSVNIHNNIELIDLYVENMLDKEKLSFDLDKKFSYDNYKDFLSELAFYLYSKCEKNDYSAKYIDIVQVYEKFKVSNIRIIADSRTIIDYIIEKGVIVCIASDRYTFRLNGIFEYFLAHHMKRNNSFLQEILVRSDLFLAFKNELEIYAGLVRNDIDTLITIYLNTLTAQRKYFEMKPEYALITYKNKTETQPILQMAVSKAAITAKPMDLADKDQFEDSFTPIDIIDSEVRLKNKYDIEKINTDLFYDHIYTLSRVFRSMDDIHDTKALKEILGYLLQCSMLLPFYMTEDINQQEESDDKKGNILLKKVFEDFSPVVSQIFLYNAISHKNLEALIRDRISSLLNSKETHQEEIFVLYFLIIEHDIEQGLADLDEVIEICSTNKVLLTDIMIKLMFYVVMHCESQSLEKQLRDRIKRINKIINPDDHSSTVFEKIKFDKIKTKAIDFDSN